MKKMFLLFSHKLTPAQIEDGKKNLGIDEFVYLPKELQQIWSNVPPEKTLKVGEHLKPIKEYIADNSKKGDYLLVQGDFGATYEMVSFAKILGKNAVYATTKREFEEKQIGDKIIKTSIFTHICFKAYF